MQKKTKLIPWILNNKTYYISAEPVNFYEASELMIENDMIITPRWELVKLADTEIEFRMAARCYWTNLDSFLDGRRVVISTDPQDNVEFFSSKDLAQWYLLCAKSDIKGESHLDHS